MVTPPSQILTDKGRGKPRARLPEPSIQPAQLPPTVMKVEIKNWHAVASWTWTSEDDVCGICHMALDGCAPGAVGPGDDSPVVWGRCSHYFHLMCINTWLHNKNTCPICRRKWEFASAPKPAPATPGRAPPAAPS